MNTSAVELGTVVNFTCSSVAKPASHQFELFNGETKLAVIRSGFFSSAVSQSGVYSCEAVNAVGRQRSNNVNITVYGKFVPMSSSIVLGPRLPIFDHVFLPVAVGMGNLLVKNCCWQ